MEGDSKNDKDLVQQNDLPYDLILQNILTRLPIKPLVRFKSVSKLWYSSLSSPRFASTHFKFDRPCPSTEHLLIRSNRKFQLLSYEDGDLEAQMSNMEVDFDAGDEKLGLVGSCNGLVCLGSHSGCLFIVWNPITREFRKYSDNEARFFASYSSGFMVTWGFGYVSAVDDYKVVRICKKISSQSIRVHVFSLRFEKWRRVDTDITQNFSALKMTQRLPKPGVLVNEILYWMGGVPPLLEGLQRKIFAFDLALELFDTFPNLDVCTPLAWVTGDECLDEFLCVIEGCLSKYGRLVKSGEGVITILKRPGETEQIRLSIDLVRSMCKHLIGFRGNGKIFTQYYGRYVPYLGIIDPSSRPMMYTRLMTLERVLKIEIASYSPTLISPIAITG